MNDILLSSELIRALYQWITVWPKLLYLAHKTGETLHTANVHDIKLAFRMLDALKSQRPPSQVSLYLARDHASQWPRGESVALSYISRVQLRVEEALGLKKRMILRLMVGF